MTKLTPWFPAGVKPVRPGVYEVECGYFDKGYSYFDGGRFNAVYSQVDWAYTDREFEGCGCSVVNWRGLSENPDA